MGADPGSNRGGILLLKKGYEVTLTYCCIRAATPTAAIAAAAGAAFCIVNYARNPTQLTAAERAHACALWRHALSHVYYSCTAVY